MSTLKTTLFLTFACVISLAAAAPVQADIIEFTDPTKRIDGDDWEVRYDTLKQTLWFDRVKNTESRARPWEIKYFRVKTNRNTFTQFDDDLSSLARSGANAVDTGKWEPFLRNWESKWNEGKTPADYPNRRLEAMHMRLKYYYLRALVETAKDEAGHTAAVAAYQDYVNSNKSYADAVLKDKVRDTALLNAKVPTAGKVKSYQGADLGALHATTLDAWMVWGNYLASQGEVVRAWDEAFEMIDLYAFELQGKARDDQYITRYAIPALDRAASLFRTAAEPDWEKARSIYEQISRRAAGIRETILSTRAKLEGASCRLESGDVRGARADYLSESNRFEEMAKRDQREAPRRGVLTSDESVVFALAYNGLGKVAVREGNMHEALGFYSVSIANFSADDEARAEALVEASRTLAAIGASAKNKAYYVGVANSYLEEVRLTLANTRAAMNLKTVQQAVNALVTE